MRDHPAKKRRPEGATQTRSGHNTGWEDCFVQVFGVDWRAIRDAQRSLGEWMLQWPAYCEALCRHWHLPPPTSSIDKEPWIPLRASGMYTLACLPMPDLPEWCYQFATGSCRVLFLVDCQTAANLANGIADLTDEDYDPLLRRICRQLRDLWQNGYLPRRDFDDYISWIPRTHNATADFLANVALQDKDQYECSHDINASLSNLIIMSDGGFRGGWGSAAWAIFAVQADHVQLAHFAYRSWSGAKSAFQTEMVALSEAVTQCHNIILQGCKRIRV